jgi:chromosome partitioning protein
MRTIVIGATKGGVGKTSVATNLAGLLARTGAPTVIIDLDPQGDTRHDLGVKETDDGLGLMQAASSGKKPPVIKGVRDNLDVVAGGSYLVALSALLAAHHAAAQEMLTRSIAALSADYRFVVIDTPPAGSALQEGALIAADGLLIPTGPDEASIANIQEIANTFSRARTANQALELIGVFLFGVGATSRKVIRESAAALIKMFDGAEDAVMTTPRDPSEPDGDRQWLTIRDVKATAVECRKFGLLAHELEAQRTRINSRTGETMLPPASVTGLAGDYERLATEVASRIMAIMASRAATAGSTEVTA